jgi:hypothetical protein
MIVKQSYENLLRIKNILDLGNLLGLVCNIEKTLLLPINTPKAIEERIANLGFVIADKVTILHRIINR